MKAFILSLLGKEKKEELSINEELEMHARSQADLLEKKLEEMPKDYQGDQLLEKIDELKKICSK